VGAYSKHFKLLLVGRCLLGIGGETLFVIQAVYTSKWFVDQELSFAMGFS